MQIDFERSGGFAGLTLKASVDTQKLSAGDASELEKLISESHFFDLPPQIKPAGSAADRFQYHLTISASDRTHTVDVQDGELPGSLQPLIDRLTQLARKRA